MIILNRSHDIVIDLSPWSQIRDSTDVMQSRFPIRNVIYAADES